MNSLSSYICTQRPLEFCKRVFTNFTCNFIKIERNFRAVKTTIGKMNPDYYIVITRLHLYYDMKLATFGINRIKNLIIQFPVFIQPYTEQPLVLYQLETVPVPIIDQNTRADSYTHL